MAYTSPSTINGSEGIGAILTYVNEVTNYWFSNLFLVAIFVIFFMGYARTNDDDWVGGLAIASYVTFIIGTFMWIIGFVSGLTFAVLIGVTLVSSIILYIDKKED